MGSDGEEGLFGEVVDRVAGWARRRARVDVAEVPVVDVPPDVPAGLARVWSTPALLEDLRLARWTVGWVGVLLESGFRALGMPSSPVEPSWAATVFDAGVSAAAARATLPELLAELGRSVPGLDRGLPWRPDPETAPAEATASTLAARLRSGPAEAEGEVLLRLVHERRDRRLAVYAELAATRLGFEGALHVPASHALATALTGSLNRAAPVAGAPDQTGAATVHAMRAWAELEWQAGMVREDHYEQLGRLRLERDAERPPFNWRVVAAQRAQRSADAGFRFALGRPPQTVEVATTWQSEADLDLCDAIRFAEPEPAARRHVVQAVGTWLRTRVRGPR